MRFANSCYIDRGKLASAQMIVDGKKVSWEIVKVPRETVTSTISRNIVDPIKCLSKKDVMRLIYNVALGQRSTTPEYSNQFIDRHEKTFFREGAKFTIALKQDSVTNISAIANYIHMCKWTAETGVVEHIYDDYRCIQATLALLLLDTLNGKRRTAHDTEIINDKKKNNLCDQHITNEDLDQARQVIKDETSALRFIEGVMAACCWRDHSKTEKDLHNSKIRTALAPYEEAMEYAIFDEDRFWEAENIETISSMADIAHELWVVKAGTDQIVDVVYGHEPNKKSKKGKKAKKE